MTDFATARAAMVRRSSSSLRQRAKSDAFSADFVGSAERDGTDEAGRAENIVGGRTPSDRTKLAIRDAEERLRGLAWETVRARFEQYSDEVRFCVGVLVGSEMLTTGGRVTSSCVRCWL